MKQLELVELPETYLEWSDAVYEATEKYARITAKTFDVDVEEFTADALAHVFNRCKDLKIRKLSGISTVCYRLAIQQYRVKQRKQGRDVDLDSAERVESSATANAEAVAQIKLLARSHPRLLLVFAGREFGMKDPEIAKGLNMSLDELASFIVKERETLGVAG